MKYSLLAVSTPPAINIGDYIQALASKQFLPHVDSFVEREKLKDYNGDRTSIIMNAYYMHDGNQWPPSDKINPLFVAVHVNKLAQKQMLSEEGIAYFKKYEPIGCRDLETERVLKACGVDAYFSGCMTLTLGKHYKAEVKDKKLCFVDVKLPIKGRKEQLSLLLRSIYHLKTISVIEKKMSYSSHDFHSRLRIWFKAAKLYFSFKGIISEDLFKEAGYITQEDSLYNTLPNNEARIQAAEDLIKKYSKCSLVITSRIHCALPCLAIETPVYYVYDNNMPEHSKCRLDGLVQLFNVIHWNGQSLMSDDINLASGISLDSIVPNKKDYQRYATLLAENCQAFIDNIKES